MKKENKRIRKSILIGVIVVSLFMAPSFSPIPERGWSSVAATGNPGVGSSGMVNLYIYPHDATPSVTYSTNLSTATAYAHRDTWNGSMTGSVPFDKAFDIVIKARFNTTHAYNSSGTTWMLDWVRANLTCADLGISTLTGMTAVQTATSNEYMWVQFYINNGGTGYTMSHGETYNVTYASLEAYY